MGLMFINGRSKGLAIAILNRRQDDLLFLQILQTYVQHCKQPSKACMKLHLIKIKQIFRDR